MQEDNLNAGTGDGIRGKDAAWHKRRVKRMKVIIVVIILILLILPTVLCIFLGMKVSRLQNQVDRLSSIRNDVSTDLAEKEHKPGGNHAYAAQNPDPEGTDLSTQSTVNTGSEAEQRPDGDTTGVPTPAVSQESTKPEETSSGNLSGAELPVTIGDLITPALDTGGDDTGITFGDPSNAAATAADPSASSGAEATDLKSKTSDEKKTDAEVVNIDGKAGKVNASSAKDDNKTENPKKPEDGEIKIASTGLYAGKKVYLTFDDGPSIYTEEILDILKQYNVKATFFVVGKTDKKSKQLYKRIVDEGHTLGMHSYSHVYKQIYNSLEDFDKDFTKLWKLLYDTTGYMPSIYRFPGGSGNLVNKNGMDEFIRYLKDKNILYYDWNVVNGDATGEEFTKEQLNQNVLEGVASKKRSIVLLHDAQSKRITVDSLPELLETLTSQGAELLPLQEDVAPIQQIRAEEVK